MWHMGLVAPWHLGSSQTRYQTDVPCIESGFLTTGPPGKPFTFLTGILDHIPHSHFTFLYQSLRHTNHPGTLLKHRCFSKSVVGPSVCIAREAPRGGQCPYPSLRPQAAEKRRDLKTSVCRAPGSGIMPGPRNLSMELIAFLWLNFRT